MPESFFQVLQAASEAVLTSRGMVLVTAVYAGLVLVAILVGAWRVFRRVRRAILVYRVRRELEAMVEARRRELALQGAAMGRRR